MKVPPWGKTPRDSIERECERRGKGEVVAGCVSLLNGKSVDAELIYALGGPPARWVFTGDEPGPDYWLRVWAARGLLWAWDEAARPSIMIALEDDAWRVREMALRVVAKHRLVEAATAVAGLRADPSSRVASAASRAHARLTQEPRGGVVMGGWPVGWRQPTCVTRQFTGVSRQALARLPQPPEPRRLRRLRSNRHETSVSGEVAAVS